MRHALPLVSSIFMLSCASASPQEPPRPPAAPKLAAPTPPATAASAEPVISPFVFTRVMIPMRDGVKLETVILTPRSAAKPLPFLFWRTPYGVPRESDVTKPRPPNPLDADGYIRVFQNLRGRFLSEGTFVMTRSPRDRKDARAIDESTDAYDSIEWLLHNVPNHNGRVGMLGTSYDAWTATMAVLDPHPALKAVVEAASPADQFVGDDYHHNGAFRLSYCFEYTALLEASKETNTQFSFDRLDTYAWYLALGPLSRANDLHFHGKMPTWNNFVAHPNRDAFWDRQAFAAHLKKTTVPILNVAGWWDQEDFYGPVKIYDLLEPSDAGHLNYLVSAPGTTAAGAAPAESSATSILAATPGCTSGTRSRPAGSRAGSTTRRLPPGPRPRSS